MQGLLIERIKTFFRQIREQMSTFDAYFTRGGELYNDGKYQLAVEFFKIALKQSNAESYANYNLALAYQQLNKDSDAIKYYEKFLQDYPFDQNSLYNIALIHYKKNEFEEAATYFAESFKYKQDEENVKALNYIQSGSIGVWCPYYGLDSNFTMSYSDHANMMKDTLGYDKVDCYYASDASVNSFKNFDRYGVILIDSHGLDYNGGGYIAIPRPGSYSNQDIADGHLVMGSGFIGMRGTFMEKYCDTLQNPIIYTGICYGLAADNLYGPCPTD